MNAMVLSYRRPTTLLMLVALLAALVAVVWLVTPALAQDSADPSHGGGGDDNVAAVGLLQSMPEGGGVGEYVVDDTTYTADSDTEFETENGDLAVGVCVKVRVEQESPTVAEKIQTLPSGMCDGEGGGDGGGDDDGDHDRDRNEIEVYGRLVSMPTEGMVGEWVIDDAGTQRTFTADDDTEFKQRRGGFAVGGCVEVEADESTPTVAEQIETESDYKCNGDDDDGDGNNEWDGRLFGTITALPSDPNLLGDWTVGAFTFTVTTTTELDDRGGTFAVGSLIKVDFYVDDGQTIATRIRLVYHHGGPGWGDHWGRLGHAWGTVEALPADPFVGSWTISGVPYTVTTQTRLKANGGAFEVGATVKVKYYVADDGGRVAWEIRTTTDRGGAENGWFKFVGFVESAPEGSLIGAWVIGGTTFTATSSTRFKEDDGLLVVGAYAEVEYKIVNGQRVIKELESEVPPGSGDDNSAGVIQQGGDDGNANEVAAAAAADPTATVWKISGRDYIVTTSTELNSNDGPLTVGSNVVVNSYTNAQGQQVATRVAGVIFTNFNYLPLGRGQ